MIPALSQLWQTCFGDDMAYIQFFMDHRFRPEDTLVWLEENQPVGVAYLLPCRIGTRAARYGYAISVLPPKQRCGIGQQLLRGAQALCHQEDALLFVAPRPGVEPYYHNLGFQDSFYYRTQRYLPQGTPKPLSVTDATPQRYLAMREAAFCGVSDVHWDYAAVTYALAEQRRCGGFAHIVTWAGGDSLIFGSVSRGTLYLRETSLTPNQLPQLVSSLCQHYQTACVQCDFPSPPGPDCRARGCCTPPISELSGWLGLDLT